VVVAVNPCNPFSCSHASLDLTEEERASIFSAPEFFEFFEQSSKIMQRALNDPYDYTRDYRIGTDGTS
jgi:hypothetical protein